MSEPFVVNVRDARWVTCEGFGAGTTFERRDDRFEQVGINIRVLGRGDKASMYHGETAQEDFLVLAGECMLIVEDEERLLKAWDFVHCPAGTAHVFVGAGSGPCAVLAVGTRPPEGDIDYPAAHGPRNGAASGAEARDDPR